MFIGEVSNNTKITITLKDFEGDESIYTGMTVKTFLKNKYQKKVVIDDLEFANNLSNAVCISVSAELKYGVYLWKDVEVVKLNKEVATAKMDSGESVKVDVTSAIIKTEFNAEYTDRRIAPRINLNIPCTISYVNDNRLNMRCCTLIKDISSSGVGLITQCEICEVGDILKLDFKDTSLKLQVECTVKVVRTRVLNSGEIEYGATIEGSCPSAEDYVRLKSQEMCLSLYTKRK